MMYELILLQVIVLKALGIIIPMYIVTKTIGAIQNTIRRYHGSDYDTSLSEENDRNDATHQENLIHSQIIYFNVYQSIMNDDRQLISYQNTSSNLSLPMQYAISIPTFTATIYNQQNRSVGQPTYTNSKSAIYPNRSEINIHFDNIIFYPFLDCQSIIMY